MGRTDGNEACRTDVKCVLKQCQTLLFKDDFIHYLSTSFSFSPSFAPIDRQRGKEQRATGKHLAPKSDFGDKGFGGNSRTTFPMDIACSGLISDLSYLCVILTEHRVGWYSSGLDHWLRDLGMKHLKY